MARKPTLTQRLDDQEARMVRLEATMTRIEGLLWKLALSGLVVGVGGGAVATLTGS